METTLFERIGGEEAIVAAVDLFYEKVNADPDLGHYFQNLSQEKLNAKMVSFMAWAFGGPSEYKGRDLRTAHKHLVRSKGLGDKHFDLVAGHLVSTLKELGIDEPTIEEVVGIVSGTRDEVLDR